PTGVAGAGALQRRGVHRDHRHVPQPAVRPPGGLLPGHRSSLARVRGDARRGAYPGPVTPRPGRARTRPVGTLTRGTTNPNRLRRADRWMAWALRDVLRS